MPLYQAVVLAIVQGLTEFLPVSSTAHLTLFPWLLGWKDPGLTFDVALHAGTLVAVLVFFWRLWVDLVRSAIGLGARDDPTAGENRKLFWFLAVATLPAAGAGWFFERGAESHLRSPSVIATALITVALLMWAGESHSARAHALAQVSFQDSLVVGVAQALAVIPGVSRSGITMTAGLFRGMRRDTSARFSFLLSTPIIAGAAFKKVLELHHEGIPREMLLPFVAGMIVAALVGYLVIGILIRYLERGTFKIFIVYRILLGMIVLLLGWGLARA